MRYWYFDGLTTTMEWGPFTQLGNYVFGMAVDITTAVWQMCVIVADGADLKKFVRIRILKGWARD